jgi:hypothetical protein
MPDNDWLLIEALGQRGDDDRVRSFQMVTRTNPVARRTQDPGHGIIRVWGESAG